MLLVHRVLRKLGSLIKWERLHWSIQGMGLVLGGIRGLWWAGLLLLIMLSLGVAYLTESIQDHSVLGPRFVNVATSSVGWVADRYPGRRARVVLIPSMKLRLPKLPKPEEPFPSPTKKSP